MILDGVYRCPELRSGGTTCDDCPGGTVPAGSGQGCHICSPGSYASNETKARRMRQSFIQHSIPQQTHFQTPALVLDKIPGQGERKNLVQSCVGF